MSSTPVSPPFLDKFQVRVDAQDFLLTATSDTAQIVSEGISSHGTLTQEPEIYIYIGILRVYYISIIFREQSGEARSV